MVVRPRRLCGTGMGICISRDLAHVQREGGHQIGHIRSTRLDHQVGRIHGTLDFAINEPEGLAQIQRVDGPLCYKSYHQNSRSPSRQAGGHSMIASLGHPNRIESISQSTKACSKRGNLSLGRVMIQGNPEVINRNHNLSGSHILFPLVRTRCPT